MRLAAEIRPLEENFAGPAAGILQQVEHVFLPAPLGPDNSKDSRSAAVLKLRSGRLSNPQKQRDSCGSRARHREPGIVRPGGFGCAMGRLRAAGGA